MIERTRKTKETDISLKLNVHGSQKVNVDTGHGFFDHMLNQLAFHGGWDLELKAKGDLHIDDHHLIEDVGITLGDAIQEAWRNIPDMARYGQRILPMDETLVMCAIDLCGRPYSVTDLQLTREAVGGMACEMVPHFFHSLAISGAFTLHIRKVTGSNHHHIIEASFKSLALAFREALAIRGGETSTKGVL